MHTARDKLRELRALHEDGLLSLQEFERRKNAILDAAYSPPGGAATPAPASRGTELGLMAGQEIGPQNRRYRLERLIAEGGMGQVWQAMDLATHAELGHSATVALKILPPQLTQSATHARLLIEEATQARRLAHEHIVRVYEWAQDPATASYFLIMECLDGEDLESLLARSGALSLARIDQLLTPVGEALAYAWDKHRLVHRDIKPGNVFLTKAGEVKLLDFGIAARARGSFGAVGLEAPASSGTSGYRAPEAGARQQQPGQALDVYAVAVMVYLMAAGKLPFEGVRAAGRAGQTPPRPSALTAPQWEALQQGFSIDPAARPATVAALLAALRVASAPDAIEVAQRQAREAEARHAAEMAHRRMADAEAAALRLRAERARREQEALASARTAEEKRVRKEALLLQLHERRKSDAAKTRQEQEQQRLAAQARAAAAYRDEQQRARKAQSVRNATRLAARLATGMHGLEALSADSDGVLRDAFLDGAGKGPELVLIPTGRFQMGSAQHERDKAIAAGSQESWLARETPQHWVGIEQSFALGRYPVTVGEWRQFVRATDWRGGALRWDAPGFAQTDEHPVVGVAWDDAQRYVQWLSAQSGQPYRLPSEAEWEYGCRAGTRTAFGFGEAISPALANYDGGYSYDGGPKGARHQGSTPVGEYPPNPWGLFDMHGNVWEWVQDVVHESYLGAPATGRAWEEGGDPGRRILRGGAWSYAPHYLRSAVRNGFAAAQGKDIIGFRVARDLL
ncbi:MAG: SUMF1/EgtB/PvdO family nonheme iron enzyme [Pseudomonadota bacterium]